MTDILPPAGWPNVRQLETNEFATGGANGNMNEQAKSLAARSELLKQYAALPYESKTSGYALNERVQLATGDIVRSTIASNVNNPNVDMTGWVNVAAWSSIESKPTTVAGYGITDAYTKTEVDTAISNATPTIPDATETVAGKAKIATTAIAQAGVNDADIITPKKLRDVLNATGGAPISACRAWVCFDSTTGGTIIRASNNIQSIVRTSQGKFVITFIDEMPHSDYIVLTGTRSDASENSATLNLVVNEASIKSTQNAKTTKTLSVLLGNNVGLLDSYGMSLGVFC